MVWILREAPKRLGRPPEEATQLPHLLFCHVEWTTRIISEILLAEKLAKHSHKTHPLLIISYVKIIKNIPS